MKRNPYVLSNTEKMLAVSFNCLRSHRECLTEDKCMTVRKWSEHVLYITFPIKKKINNNIAYVEQKPYAYILAGLI